MDEKAKEARLRMAAETRLKEKLAESFKDVGNTDLPRLVHELQVHQIELEIQNEELRSAQKALEEARDNYFDLYELAPIGYITLNREATIASINLTAAKMLGIDRSKLMSRGFSDFISVQDKRRWYDRFLGIMSHPPGMTLSFELEMVRADGVTFQAHVECLRRENVASPSVFRLAIFDVSKAKRIEADLRVAATAFEGQEGVMVTDADAIILRVNQAFTTITGYSAEEAIGKKPNMLQSGRQDAAFYAAMWLSISSTGGWSGEIWNKRKNGEVYPEHLAITAVKDSDGILVNYVGTLTDSSMKMELEAEKVRREKEKAEIYNATMQAANHIINTLMNQLHLVRLAAVRSEDFDPQVLKCFDDMTAEAAELIGKLSSIKELSTQVIYNSVHPE